MKVAKSPQRPSLSEAFRQADQVARTRANQRRRRRLGGRTIQASLETPLAGVGSVEMEEEYGLSLFDRVVRFFLGICLLPLCIVTAITLFQRVSEEQFVGKFWSTPAFFYFAIGGMLCMTWLFSGVLRSAWLYLYILGHELTHALFIYLSLGKVTGMSIQADGGYVITNKSNVLIALSPYFVPFWSLVSMAILIPLGKIPTDAGLSWSEIPIYRNLLFLFIGATWTFHLLFTCWMIPRDQPDLKENDTFFSLMLIILVNIILLSALICGADPELSLIQDFAYHWVNNFLDLFVEPFLK